MTITIIVHDLSPYDRQVNNSLKEINSLYYKNKLHYKNKLISLSSRYVIYWNKFELQTNFYRSNRLTWVDEDPAGCGWEDEFLHLYHQCAVLCLRAIEDYPTAIRLHRTANRTLVDVSVWLQCEKNKEK